jgi:serine/threonine protein kinase
MHEDADNPSARNPLIAGRYQLDGLLGSGSMAEVHQARDILLHRPVAIKLFRPDVDPLAQRRFGGEARVLAHLSHPGLVSIYDAGIDGAQPYLVMELIPGQSLRSRLLTEPLTSAEVIQLGTSLATAIDHVHQRGIVHRDVKPSNILLDTDSNPHVVDFGIALLVGAARLTNAGEIVGTAAYLAPEQVLGTDIAPPTDIYALGLVLLECLTGKVTYPGASHVESALARLHRPPDIPSSLPPRLAGLLAAMTDTDPGRRPTAHECQDTLRLLDPPVARLPAMAIFPGTPDRPRALLRRHRRPYLVGAAVLVTAAAGLALALGTLDSAVGQPARAARSDQSTSRTISAGPAIASVPSPSPSPAVPNAVVPTASVPVTVVVERAHPAKGGGGKSNGGDH